MRKIIKTKCILFLLSSEIIFECCADDQRILLKMHMHYFYLFLKRCVIMEVIFYLHLFNIICYQGYSYEQFLILIIC